MSSLDTEIIIVGAGPVGMTLALDLAWRGIAVTLVESRAPGEPPSVKCNHVSARSMEIFRRLGVVADVRNAGLPSEFPNDVAYRIDVAVPQSEFCRISIPCRRDRYTAQSGPDTWWPTPEPPHRINQIYLEPCLFRHVSANPRIRVLNRTRVDAVSQDARGVTVAATDLDGDRKWSIRGAFLVGCDGARSGVRKAMGTALQGTAVVERVQSSYIRAPTLLGLLGEPAWMTMSFNRHRRGTVVAIDGRDNWLIHNFLNENEPEFDSVDRDWAIRAILGVGSDFEYELLTKEDWIGRRLVAEHFRKERMFICGDAAHLWAPYAGYGMNAGIADATDLSWMLAARLKGWGCDALLDAYEAERLPITQQVSHFAMSQAMKVARQHREVSSAMQFESLSESARRDFGKQVYDLTVHQFCCGGLNFGYFYDRSPVIAYDDAKHPDYTMYDFTPSTVPGCRTPHVWLRDGRSLYDAMGPDYTLLCFSPDIAVDDIRAAAAARGVPLRVLDLSREDHAGVYDRKLVLLRPDQHVAWRGDATPAEPTALFELVRGGHEKLSSLERRRIGA